MNTYRITALLKGGRKITGVTVADSHQGAIRKMRGAMQACEVRRVRSMLICVGSLI